MNSRTKLLFAIALVLITGQGAVSFGTALFHGKRTERRRTTSKALPRTVSFRDVSGRGLLVRTWVNGAGPYEFALDTGAGSVVISSRVANELRLSLKNESRASVTGMSGVKASAHEAAIESMALGDRDNLLPGSADVIVTSGLPYGVDGVIDPAEAFQPFGYEIDLPNLTISAFDPATNPLRVGDEPPGGAVVKWIREGRALRPFVQLTNGDRALLDTGSSLGFAVRERDDSRANQSQRTIRDIGGGQISARRVAPQTIAIGSLTLRRVPTDVVSGSSADAPTLLGLAALRPFRLRFDPLHRLIEIAPSVPTR